MNKNISYDGIFKELLESFDDPSIVDTLNALFERNIPRDSKVIKLATESHDGGEERRSDILFRVDGDMYHVEVQSQKDSSIVLRVFEYSYRSAMLHGMTQDENILELEFPKSVVFYLRSTNKTPNELTVRLKLPDGNKVEYKIPTKKLNEYKPQDLLDKSLYAFVPHYPMTFEGKTDTESKEALKNGNQIIVDGLVDKMSKGEISRKTADLAISGLKEISENVLIKNGVNQKEVDEFMQAIERKYNLEPLNWREEGIILGTAKGKVEGKEEDAKNMFAEGLSFRIVQKVTGLKTDVLEKIQQEATKPAE